MKENTSKRIFNTNSALSQNCTEKQSMPSNTKTNWLFNDIWCYLSIACFDWKIDVFQQRVLRVIILLIKQTTSVLLSNSSFEMFLLSEVEASWLTKDG